MDTEVITALICSFVFEIIFRFRRHLQIRGFGPNVDLNWRRLLCRTILLIAILSGVWHQARNERDGIPHGELRRLQGDGLADRPGPHDNVPQQRPKKISGG